MPHAVRLAATALTVLSLLSPVPAVHAQSTRSRVLVLFNARIWTADSSVPRGQALAIRDGRVIAVGTEADVMEQVRHLNPDREDLGGSFVVPGFIDTHTHFERAGQLLLGVNLLDVSDDQGLRTRIREADRRLPPGSWMIGGDWGAYDLESNWVPSRNLLDSLTGVRPALLNNWNRTKYVANTQALRAAGLDPGTVTGTLDTSQLRMVREAVPPPSLDQLLAGARLALEDLRSHGVTSIHDITSATAMRIFQYLEHRDSLTVRVCARPTLDKVTALATLGISDGFGDDMLRICGLKGFVDGIMGNSSAKFREPYNHQPGSSGRWRAMMSPPGNMERLIALADSAGLSPGIHAIGDLAVDTLLDMYEAVIKRDRARPRRFRVIHAQVVEDDDFARFGELGLIAEVQPYHAIDDMRWMETRIGNRSRGAYAFRSLKDGGALLVFGSDWPGTNASWYPAEPLLGIYAAVTRQTLDGEPEAGWYPDQRLTVEESLKAYTVNAAYAAGEERWKGRLMPGFAADLTVLSEDLFRIDPRNIRDTRVLKTMVGGTWVFDAERPTP